LYTISPVSKGCTRIDHTISEINSIPGFAGETGIQ